MTLVTILAETIAGNIAEKVFKLWAGKVSKQFNAEDSLADAISKYIEDPFAQQKAEHRFADVGSRIAQSLIPLFELEGDELPENSLEAVAHELAITLTKSQITSELLVEIDLDARDLKDRMLEYYSISENQFSEAQIRLYHKSLNEICYYIIFISVQLPNFTKEVFQELLQRETELISLVEDVLKEVQKIREDTQRGRGLDDDKSFETEYRIQAANILNRMELFGASPNVSSASKRYPLNIAYVSLSVKQETDFSSASEADEINDLTDEDGDDIVSVDEILSGYERILIRGLAGSGKTTLLKWIGYNAAARKFEGALEPWNDKVPFFIRLRHFPNHDLPSPDNFCKKLFPAISDAMPKGWAYRVLEQGRALILIDGVDEISNRETVRTWIDGLVTRFGESGNSFFVSSRPSAVERDWLESFKFKNAELQPMELQDIYNFVAHWHQAIRTIVTTDAEKDRLDDLSNNLKQVIKSSRPIRNLTTNPLLCAMLCALHRDLRKQLPRDRIELYDTCSRMFLERRDTERKVDLDYNPNLSFRQKERLLEELAHHFLINSRSEVEIEIAEKKIGERLRLMEGFSQDDSKPVLEYLIERSGVIRKPVQGFVDFTHKTFQEYYAARELLEKSNLNLLINNADNHQWREVIILAVGRARIKERSKIILGILERGDNEPEQRHQLHLLAVACLETAVDIEEEVKNEVDARLSDLLPPTTVAEAKALSSAGNLAVPELEKYHTALANEAAMCVRALSFIGSG